MNIICPVCGEKLNNNGKSFVCPKRHTFDLAKEGYVNFLLSGKSGDLTGDNREMALARRDFLSKGYYLPLALAVKSELRGMLSSSCAVDICCGEGYYTEIVSEGFDGEFYGFDISKQMIRLAAKRKSNASFAVANMKKLPLADSCVDFAMHLFAPFCEQEFARILSEGGILVSVKPGREHLYEIKQAVYDEPYENDETLPDYRLLKLTEQKRIKTVVKVGSNEDLLSLFSMTPY
ncbi:MAG: methyltransferase domain-containing protein, partial [Clostridia bacterium]|nr:methyltransferase domain-containing protein [Clostridia bacterium]